ncbi:hypothetical protein RB597_009455 [Gaeumannomyces tritici]
MLCRKDPVHLFPPSRLFRARVERAGSGRKVALLAIRSPREEPAPRQLMPCPTSTMASSSGGARAMWLLCFLLVASLFRVSLCQSGYTWRHGSSVAVLNNTLFMMGGQTSNEERDWVPDTRVWAISLDKSWTTGDSFMRSTEKQGAAVEYMSLWPSPRGDSIYTWGGRDLLASERRAKDPGLRIFKPRTVDDSNGEGSWPEKGQAPKDLTKSPPQRIYRGRLGSWTSCNGLGFYMGGQLDDSTDSTWPYKQPDDTTMAPLTGLAIYDMETQKWTNRSAEGFGIPGRGGVHMAGTAVCLPKLGTDGKGVLLFLAGNQRVPDKALELEDVFLYDIGSGKFHKQHATKDKDIGGFKFLKPRNHACAVAAKSDKSKNYEVILFGGNDENAAETYVLMVPGFHWIRAVRDSPESMRGSRMGHECAVAGSGKRQMIAVGGTKDEPPEKFLPTQDPWGPNGVQILDMTELTWSGSYKHDAPAYEPAKEVKAWYSNSSNLKSVSWNTQDIRALFADAIDNPNPPNGEPGPVPGPPISIIVGAAVGGAAGLALVVCVVYFCYFRPRRRRAAHENPAELPFEPHHQQPTVVVEVGAVGPNGHDKAHGGMEGYRSVGDYDRLSPDGSGVSSPLGSFAQDGQQVQRPAPELHQHGFRPPQELAGDSFDVSAAGNTR